jgi:hypothetical protein
MMPFPLNFPVEKNVLCPTHLTLVDLILTLCNQKAAKPNYRNDSLTL